MMAAAAPIIPIVAGAGLGAALNKDNRLAGAALGALGGAVAGPAISAGMSAMGAGAGATGAAEAAGYGAALPVGGEQAAMLAAQTEGFGGEGLGLTSGAFVPGEQATGSMFGGLGGNSNFSPARLGMRMLSAQQQPQQQQAPMPGASYRSVSNMSAYPTQSFASLAPYGHKF